MSLNGFVVSFKGLGVYLEGNGKLMEAILKARQ